MSCTDGYISGSFDESVHNYLSHRPAATSEEIIKRPSTCSLSINWPSAEIGSAPDTHESSYYLDTIGFFEHRNQNSQLSQLDPVLDADTQAVQATDKVERTTEEGYVDILQASTVSYFYLTQC